MRPRVFPAEDSPQARNRRRDRSRFNEAAGIPRGRPRIAARRRRRDAASMRPRVFPAEDAGFFFVWYPSPKCFNEAAGIPRGRRANRSKQPIVEPRASMRPRVFPAEDLLPDRGARVPGGRFNEAAGIPRGRPTCRPQCSAGRRSFNEAAGIPRGRRPVDVPDGLDLRASMRPRVFPAEDAKSHGIHLWSKQASMRPRVFPAEDGSWRRRTRTAARFNEAAGIPRGRLASSPSLSAR